MGPGTPDRETPARRALVLKSMAAEERPPDPLPQANPSLFRFKDLRRLVDSAVVRWGPLLTRVLAASWLYETGEAIGSERGNAP